MKASSPAAWRLLVVGTFLTLTASLVDAGPPGASGAKPEELLGERLFDHNWARPQGWTGLKPLGANGDGLGPVFNDVSCARCHSAGGPGGAGGNEKNVELLSVLIPRGSTRPQRSGIFQRARQVHPHLAPGNETVILHRYGFGPADDTASYDSWREALLGTGQPDRQPLTMTAPRQVIDGVAFRLSQRNTPALWGTAEIERLRRTSGERSRRNHRLQQNGSASGVTGRVPRTSDGRPGWYGWRGHIGSLHEFVLNACANELGLTVTGRPQPGNPVAEEPRTGSQPAQPGLDLTVRQVRALTQYIMSLPRPEQIFPTDPTTLENVYAGERVFESTGCGECHVSQIGRVKQIYTDFLLHDMGPSLSDPSSAFPEPPPGQTVRRRTRSGGGYSGGSSSSTIVTGPKPRPDSPKRTRVTQEWRTPPLWGVADTPPYLHDGRAETLDEAIRMHTGEADRAAEAYQYLSAPQRSQLLTFLGTLRAPQSPLAVESTLP